jgi:hypothetical protein
MIICDCCIIHEGLCSYPFSADASPRKLRNAHRSFTFRDNYQRAGRALFADVQFLALKRRWVGISEIPDGHRWDSSPKIRFAPDSTLEGDGFELPVPRERRYRDLTFCASSMIDRIDVGANRTHSSMSKRRHYRQSVTICHCTDCQRLTGLAFRANISKIGLTVARPNPLGC